MATFKEYKPGDVIVQQDYNSPYNLSYLS